VLRGTLPETVEVVEHGLRFKVDVAQGQKTGFYLDQRDNRHLTETLARDKSVLNCFCYTGGFSLYALRGGAKSVLSIDASADALRIAESNLIANGLETNKAEWQCDDVFLALRKLRDQGKKFDFIILDPPKFAPTAAFAEKPHADTKTSICSASNCSIPAACSPPIPAPVVSAKNCFKKSSQVRHSMPESMRKSSITCTPVPIIRYC
jgi:tRNA G37 N-methylase Trm5